MWCPQWVNTGGIIFKKQRWVAFWLNSNQGLLSAASKTQKEDKIRIWGQNSSFSCFLGYASKGQIGDDVELRYKACIYWVLPSMRYCLKGFTWVEPLLLTQSSEQGLLSSFYNGGNWGPEIEVEQSVQEHTASKWDFNLSAFIPGLLCLATIFSCTHGSSSFLWWFQVKELPWMSSLLQ